jgi:hypothetical protein
MLVSPPLFLSLENTIWTYFMLTILRYAREKGPDAENKPEQKRV